MISPVAGKTVLVTGANRGIGRAIVERCLRDGAKHVYAGVRRVETAPPDTIPLQLDVGSSTSVQAAAQHLQQQGVPQIIVNSAGILDTSGPMDDTALEVLHKQMDTNVYGMMRLAQSFLPLQQQQTMGDDSIPSWFIQINSASSLRSKDPDLHGYAISKAASYVYTQALRRRFGPPMRILSVHPGPIATDMVGQYGLAPAQAAGVEQVCACVCAVVFFEPRPLAVCILPCRFPMPFFKLWKIQIRIASWFIRMMPPVRLVRNTNTFTIRLLIHSHDPRRHNEV